MLKLKRNHQSVSNSSTEGLRTKKNWLKISVFANIVIVALTAIVASGGYLIHQSNTNPNFCGTCHIMQSRVSSYLTGKNLDHVHQQAGVQCKDCHDYPISAEIKSGVDALTGNYTVDPDGELIRRKFGDELCLKCHISYQHIAQNTDFLAKNPHSSHFGQLTCNTCHISHGEQVNYCAECHDNGGQRMIGEAVMPRTQNP